MSVDLVAAREMAERLSRMQMSQKTERTLRNIAMDIADCIWESPFDLFERNLQTVEEQELLQDISQYLAKRDLREGWRRTYHAIWKDQKVHRQLCWARFYKAARAHAAGMLAPDSGITEVMRERIADAIFEDREKRG